MLVTSFWHPDGRPMSSQQFIELLYGQLPEFVKDEAELRQLCSAPGTRRKLLQGLKEKGFGADQLAEMQRIIEAENARLYIHSRFTSKQEVFLNFVLQLTPLLQLRYQNSIADAVDDLGPAAEIGQMFAGFQRYLYEAVG
jgi:type I restriction enzyme R subunit